ncbi:MAG: cupin domain-containing protein [Candidatus Latescibacteria bacterium]|jgi:quercetin dioxygenase-like cupin family protein|nr:cupin domain-containing protein [Candidatus Latescibacterota bacterium]
MCKSSLALTLFLVIILNLTAVEGFAEQQGTPVFGSTDPSKYREISDCHKGAGTIKLMSLLGSDIFKTNFLGVSAAEIPPECSIGEHIHRYMEEIFIITDGNAQFTINGRTAELPPGSMVVCQKGSSHGIYNHTDKTIQWVYFAVSEEKGKGDAVDFNDDLANTKVESPAPFLWTNLDRRLLKPASNAHDGKGTILFKRLWNSDSFKTKWEFIDHCILPPGTSIGYHQHNVIEEVYYLVSGSGRMTVNDVTWDVKAGDAIPCTLHDSHGLYNNGTDDIVLIVCSCNSKGKGERDTNNWGDDLSGR